MNKSILALLVAAVLVITLVPYNTVDASDDGYVTINLTFNPEYMEKVENAEMKAEKAVEQTSGHYSNLVDAQAALWSVFKSGSDGSDNGPLYAEYAHLYGDQIQFKPVTILEFLIHGTVEIGSNNLRLGITLNEWGPPISDIRITGYGDDARISGNGGFYAQVAGSYDHHFVQSGSMTVSNIEFTSNTGTIGINAYADSFTTNSEKAADTVLVVEDCIFHSQLYMYANDYDVNTSTKIVRNNTFVNDGSTAYGYFFQSNATSVIITGNTFNGYSRGGVNIHEQPGEGNSNEAVVEISDNSFANNTDHKNCCVQFTNAKQITFEDNTMTNILGNAFGFHEAGRIDEGVAINNNYIQAEYMMFNRQGDIKVTSEGNKQDVDHPNQGFDKDINGGAGGVTDLEVVIEGEDVNSTEMPPTAGDDEDLPPFIPTQPADDDDTVTIVACAAAAAVAAILAVFLVIDRKG